MSIGNSQKEFYYALYLKLYKEELEKTLNVKLSEIELEKNIDGRKVDLCAVTEDNKYLFMEIQLSQSDAVHLEQLKFIENQDLNNIILVWVATSFKTSLLDEMEERIKLSCKNICFVALKVNEKVIEYLKIINSIFVNEVIQNLKRLNQVDNHFKIIEIFYRLQDENNTICAKRQEEALDLNKKKDVMRYLLNELRREIYYYPSIYRDKKLDNNVIVLAGGKAEINYFIGLNRRNFIFIELRFGELTKEIFNELLKKEEEANDKLDYVSEFDVENRKIGTYLYFNNAKKEKLIKQIARITNKYIRYFAQYTFPNGTN